jgi:hypothetical protein
MPTDMSRIAWNGWFIHSHHLRQGRSSFFSGYLGIAIQFTETGVGHLYKIMVFVHMPCWVLSKTAVKTIQGIETMHRIRKVQIKLKNLSASNKVLLFNQLFGLMA